MRWISVCLLLVWSSSALGLNLELNDVSPKHQKELLWYFGKKVTGPGIIADENLGSELFLFRNGTLRGAELRDMVYFVAEAPFTDLCLPGPTQRPPHPPIDFSFVDYATLWYDRIWAITLASPHGSLELSWLRNGGGVPPDAVFRRPGAPPVHLLMDNDQGAFRIIGSSLSPDVTEGDTAPAEALAPLMAMLHGQP